MFCVYCGTKNPDEATVCVFCGQRVHNFQPQPEVAAASAADSDKTPAPQVVAQPAAPPPAQVAATVLVQKHLPHSLPTHNPPSGLHALVQKNPVGLFAAAAAIVVLVPTIVLVWQWNSNRLAKTHRLESVLKDAADSQASSAEFTRHIQELRSRPTLAMKEYYDQCVALEPGINTATSASEKSRSLLDQVIPEFYDDAKTLSTLNSLKRALDLDQRLQNDVRQEVLLSKTLMSLEPSEQVEFYSMSIHPLQEEEKQLAVEEQQTLAQIRDDSRKLPSSVSRSLLNQ
jgi:hypothetical protein